MAEVMKCGADLACVLPTEVVAPFSQERHKDCASNSLARMNFWGLSSYRLTVRVGETANAAYRGRSLQCILMAALRSWLPVMFFTDHWVSGTLVHPWERSNWYCLRDCKLWPHQNRSWVCGGFPCLSLWHLAYLLILESVQNEVGVNLVLTLQLLFAQ